MLKAKLESIYKIVYRLLFQRSELITVSTPDGRVIVYRFENEEGIGPYKALPYDISSVLPGTSRFSTEQHPGGRDDGADWDKVSFTIYGCKFAFTSLEQRDAWFNFAQQTVLNSLGFECFEYHVPEQHIVFMNKQCAFKEGTGEKIRKVS